MSRTIVEPILDPILIPNDKRFVMFPIQHSDVWRMYKKHVSCFWTTEEIDLSQDVIDWSKLDDNTKHFISLVLAFFASSDGIVLENLALRFFGEVQSPEVRAFYGFQIAMENCHSETYSLLIETLIKNEGTKNKLFNSIENYPCIRKKADWAQKWINDKESSFAVRLVAFACVEGIFFSGAFASIYWIKKKGFMPGLTFSNELIARDETLHTEFAILLHSKLVKKATYFQIRRIIKEAVEIETEFICDALPCKLIGMNSITMTQYIQFIADRLCVQLGVTKLYNVSNPFDFMESISLESKTNFFERRVADYALATKSHGDEAFVFADEF